MLRKKSAEKKAAEKKASASALLSEYIHEFDARNGRTGISLYYYLGQYKSPYTYYYLGQVVNRELNTEIHTILYWRYKFL